MMENKYTEVCADDFKDAISASSGDEDDELKSIGTIDEEPVVLDLDKKFNNEVQLLQEGKKKKENPLVHMLNYERYILPVCDKFIDWDPAPMLKLKGKEICPLVDYEAVSAYDIIHRQNIYWVKSLDKHLGFATVDVRQYKTSRAYYVKVNPEWCVKHNAILTECSSWCPENLIPVLIQIVSMHPKSTILIGVTEAQMFVKAIWEKDLAERSKNPDEPNRLELSKIEKENLFSSLVVLIAAQDPFIRSNKILDLYKYLPFPKLQERELKGELYAFVIANKCYPLLLSPPKDTSKDIEYRLSHLRNPWFSCFAYDNILNELQGILNEVSKAYCKKFDFVKPIKYWK